MRLPLDHRRGRMMGVVQETTCRGGCIVMDDVNSWSHVELSPTTTTTTKM